VNTWPCGKEVPWSGPGFKKRTGSLKSFGREGASIFAGLSSNPIKTGETKDLPTLSQMAAPRLVEFGHGASGWVSTLGRAKLEKITVGSDRQPGCVEDIGGDEQTCGGTALIKRKPSKGGREHGRHEI